ncbi:alpha/beta hydrolase [Hymenobacter sedentarius]|uniref:Alpha/beta hydrolase n=1 Tax=Hymenobacter sedentarius TaxID=1411621 RepID=A0A0U4C8S4_9BACT|nr:alpha/beta hydrolase [Hymenobacter sedentarius]ALW86680.1 alpha/beta hydrolase [Hymenobacter sedentarius]
MRPFLLLFCLLFSGLLAVGQPVPYGNNAAAGHYQLVRGVKLYYEVYGKGQPLLLIHGNAGSIEKFKANIPYFAQHYQVIAVDSRAHGKSVDPGDSLSFEMMADDFAGLLTALHLDSVNVLGWSDGGINALVLALRHPSKVRRLASTGANLSPDSAALVPAVWKAQQRYYQANKGKALPDPGKRNQWKVFTLDVLQPNIPLATLRRITAPAFIIAGDRDMITHAHTVAIYRHLRRAWLWIVPNSGHATLRDQADEFNRKVDEFFQAKAIPALAH